jgi:hypothetical protein
LVKKRSEKGQIMKRKKKTAAIKKKGKKIPRKTLKKVRGGGVYGGASAELGDYPYAY